MRTVKKVLIDVESSLSWSQDYPLLINFYTIFRPEPSSLQFQNLPCSICWYDFHYSFFKDQHWHLPLIW
jgi:hypothetical protein